LEWRERLCRLAAAKPNTLALHGQINHGERAQD
jgi:hypothetical protein